MKKTTRREKSVKEKWILLTGASGGIGESLAICLYKAGANLVLVGREKNKLSSVQARNGFSNNRILTIEADLNQEQDREQIFTACQKLPEPISILINNAGISDFQFLSAQDEKTIIELISTNLISPMLLTRRMIPILKNAKYPAIVNIGSTFGSIAYPGFASYSASKFGLRGFSEALRRELANSHIDVCYIAPRATKTTINSKQVKEMNAALGTKMDNPEIVAAQITAAIEARRPETYIGWPEKFFARINQILPGIVDDAILKQLPVISHFAQNHELHD